MSKVRAIKGVLGNFLGTFVSRYSEYRGYLLFGFLVEHLGEMRVNLLKPVVSDADTPHAVAVRIAVVKFAEQLQKAGLERSRVRGARLTIQKLQGEYSEIIYQALRSGFRISFVAEALMDNGKLYKHDCTFREVAHVAV
jgi:hypothetical protein